MAVGALFCVACTGKQNTDDTGLITETGPSTEDTSVEQADFPWDGAINADGTPSSGRLVAHELGTTDAQQGFYEYTPPGYSSDVEWPLLIAIHGGGENGEGAQELIKLQGNGLPKLIAADGWPSERPFVVLAPQHSGEGRTTADEIHEFISFALDEYSIDSRYVYLTAYSMGAYGAWNYLQEYTGDQIAAVVPIAGDGTTALAAVGCELAEVGIWAFHGEDDTTVNVNGTIQTIDGLADCPSPPAQEVIQTIYEGVGHNSWDATYDGSAGFDIFEWFLLFKSTY
tara:strand:+ start:323 stop:1174 length:852 start_codon:yes stop_codon:yes gene_type:complete